MNVVIGFLCHHCGSETIEAACAACGASIIWNWKDGYHCSACEVLPTAVSCAECATITPLKQDCRKQRMIPGAERPHEPDRRQTPSLASDPASWKRPIAAPTLPPQRWWEDVKESISAGWPIPIALAVILHAGLLVPLIAGRDGPLTASAQGIGTAPSAMVAVVDDRSVAPAAMRDHQVLGQAPAAQSDAALSSLFTPRFDIQEAFVPAPRSMQSSAPSRDPNMLYDRPEPDGIDILPRRLDPVAFETAAAALSGVLTRDVPEPDGIDILPKRLDPAAFQVAATTLTDTIALRAPTAMHDETGPAAPAAGVSRLEGVSTASLTRRAGPDGALHALPAIAAPGPGDGVAILPVDILPIPTPPPAAAPAVKHPARDAPSAKPIAANAPQIARPAARRIASLPDVAPEDRAYVPPPSQAQPVAPGASPRSPNRGFQHPDRLGAVHADAPGATSPAPVGLGIWRYPPTARG